MPLESQEKMARMEKRETRETREMLEHQASPVDSCDEECVHG